MFLLEEISIFFHSIFLFPAWQHSGFPRWPNQRERTTASTGQKVSQHQERVGKHFKLALVLPQADPWHSHQWWTEPPSACQRPAAQWRQSWWSGLLNIWPKVKSEHFFSGQGWVRLCVWEDWGWPENQPRRRGLMFIYLWIIDHHLSCQVNRARYMPQNPSVIATKTPTSEVTAAFTQIPLQHFIMPPVFNPSNLNQLLHDLPLTTSQTHPGSPPGT